MTMHHSCSRHMARGGEEKEYDQTQPERTRPPGSLELMVFIHAKDVANDS